jgi:hypothetical protein
LRLANVSGRYSAHKRFSLSRFSYLKELHLPFEAHTARKEAIRKLYSWQDIFRQAKEEGNNIFYSLSKVFEERKVTEFQVPTLHLYVCYRNEKGEWDLDDEFALYGKVLIETEDEQLDELQLELEFYKENKYEIEKPEFKTFEGTQYSILPNSPLMEW